MRWTILLLVILTLASCRNKKTVTTISTNQTQITEKIDTTITVVGDSITRVQPLSLSKGFTHVVEHDIATIRIQIDTLSGTLTTDLVVKDRDVEVEMEKTTTSVTTTEQKTQEVTKPCNCPKGLWWKIPLMLFLSFSVGYFFGKLFG